MIACLIAGTASGVGKTTAALAIMAALRERGLVVQPFKCGPDFLDTGHHGAICGRPSCNLDGWLLDREANRNLFANAIQGADVAIVEGMMGLFDGVAGQGESGSSAEIAKILNLPIVLVLDAAKSARSIAAVVRGFETFDPEVRFAGVILNGVNSDSHYRLLKAAISSASSIPVLGRIPKLPSIAIPERHLGLHTIEEENAPEERRVALAETARQYLDINTLCARSAWEWAAKDIPARPPVVRHCRLGVARDKAFTFYYEDNLELLRQSGAEIVPFSPLEDSRLPEGLSGLYLGGGYPELYATELSANRSMLTEIRDFARSGMAIYAECGGMLYLSESLRLRNGEDVPMAGVLPLQFAMTEQLVQFGYVTVELTEDCVLGRKGTVTRGHSFHHSKLVSTIKSRRAYRLSYSLSGKEEQEGFCQGNVLASYIHLHFRSNPSLAENFVKAAAANARTEARQ